MITSANTGYLKNTASALCTMVEPNGYTRTFNKYNNIPAIVVIIGRNLVGQSRMLKGVYLISDIPEAVFYKPSDYVKFGYNTNTYTDENGVVWYSSMWDYYMNYDSTIPSGDVVNHSELVYSDEEFVAGVPIKDVLALAEPVVSMEPATPTSMLLDAGERINGDASLYYWNMGDGDLTTFPDYTKENASIAYTYPHNLIPTSIDYCPRSDWASRLVNKPIEGLLPDGTWETIATFPSSMAEGQISTLQISTQKSYGAIRIFADYLNIAYLKINGTYTNTYTKLKHYRLDITNARSWYANELCFSDIKTYVNNTQMPIIKYWAKYYTNNTYVPSDVSITLAQGDSSIQSNVSWNAYDVLSVFLDVVVSTNTTDIEDITSYILTTSNSDISKDPVGWKLWTSDNGLYWNVLDNISNANIPTERKTDTSPFIITSGTMETLTYVESDGSQYVDTLMLGNRLVDAEINIQVHDYCGNWGGILGSRDRETVSALNVAYKQDTKRIVFQRGGWSTEASYSLSAGTPYKIEMLANKLYINNSEVISLSNADFTTSIPMTFFARNQVYTSRPIDYGRYRLYSAKIWRESNTLARDFVPARIKGVIGLYDNVTESFFAPICGNPLKSPSVSDTFPLFLIDGGYMINLSNLIQSGKMRCEMEVSLSNVTNTNTLLSNDDNFRVHNYSNEKFEALSLNSSANYQYSGYYISPNTKYKLTLITSSNGLNLIYDGNSSRANGYSVNANSPMYLFGEGSGRTNTTSGSIYSCKIWDDDTLVFDLASDITEGGISVYNAVNGESVDAYGAPSGPAWVMIGTALTNIIAPKPASMGEPLPMEFWTYEGTQLINILNPDTIPTSTSPYPMMLWQEYDNVLYTNFSLENPLIGACANTNNVETLVIPESVKYIGTYAFRNTNVSEVTIASDCVYSSTSFPNGCVIHFHGE